MREVVASIQKITVLSGSAVDRNFRQGRDAVRSQHLKRLIGDETLGFPVEELANLEQDVDELISALQNNVSRLELLITPHKLSGDYRFFLEYSGGLTITDERGQFRLELFGLGVMVEELYRSLIWVNTPLPKLNEETPLLDIGALRFDVVDQALQTPDKPVNLSSDLKHHWVQFYLDLAGVFEGGILVMESGLEGEPTWRTVASSFTEFLIRIAETGGRLGYL